MDLLYYNELDYHKVTSSFKKVEKHLAAGNFTAADVKKMGNTDYYRAKLDDTNRLLFKFAKYKDNTYLLLLEVIYNHQYEKSKFLRGVQIDESKFQAIKSANEVTESDTKKLVYVNKNRNHFHLLDKFLSFDDAQNEIYACTTPLVIIGSAGSGKTALTLEKLKTLKGKVAYISLSPYLVENAQTLYHANGYENGEQEVDFLSFKEYIESIKIPRGGEIQFKQFDAWFTKYMYSSKIKEPYRIYEEIKGVLTVSVTDKPYITRSQYLNLGVKQSIFSKAQRETVYDIFEKYLVFLNESAYYDLNLLSWEYISMVVPEYDFVVVDEVQDITIVQLKLILSALHNKMNFILSGDSNQIVHPNFFSWAKIKTMFFDEALNFFQLRILQNNYRNSQQIIGLSNTLLKIKNARFGSIDKESNYLIDTVSDTVGEVYLHGDNDKVKKELNAKTQNSAKFAVLVLNNEDKKNAQQFFKTPLLFSIQEAKGLEYENIILFNLVSGNEREFDEITRGIDASILKDNIKYARGSDKEDKDLEVYKFFINSLYVAYTRSIKNIYIIEKNNQHTLFKLLGLQAQSESIKLQDQKSNNEEWLAEAHRLELQGKHDQANQIRDRLAGIQYMSNEALEELKLKALDPSMTEEQVRRERKDLYKWAEDHKDIEIIKQLSDLSFQRAVVYMKEIKKLQKEFSKDCRLDRWNNLGKVINKYGVNFRSDEDGMTALMLATQYGAMSVFDYAIKKEPDLQLRSDEGLTALQIALRSYYRRLTDKAHQQNYLPATKFELIMPKVTIQSIRCKVGDRIIKINNSSMEFFLVNLMAAIRGDIMDDRKEHAKAQYELNKVYLNQFSAQPYLENLKEVFLNSPLNNGVTMNDIMEFIDNLPVGVLAEKRRKRQYINSILANNEVDRVFIYNKKLFIRMARGCYNLNPDLEIVK